VCRVLPPLPYFIMSWSVSRKMGISFSFPSFFDEKKQVGCVNTPEPFESVSFTLLGLSGV
jgi:hypothetical protein